MENRKTVDLGIAIYSQDGFGFGNLQQTCSIACEIDRIRAEASGVTYSNSQSSQFSPNSVNQNLMKPPSIVKAGPGNWKATRLRRSFPEIHKLRQELISSVLLNYAPRITTNRWEVGEAYGTIDCNF